MMFLLIVNLQNCLHGVFNSVVGVILLLMNKIMICIGLNPYKVYMYTYSILHIEVISM